MFGPWEIVLVIVLVLLLFGAKKIPEMGRGLGSGMREFKDSIKGGFGEDKPEPRELEPGDVPAPAPADGRSQVAARDARREPNPDAGKPGKP